MVFNQSVSVTAAVLLGEQELWIAVSLSLPFLGNKPYK